MPAPATASKGGTVTANDRCNLITRHPEDFERMINALETSLHNAQLEIERQAGVIVHDTEVYGQIIRGNEKRIAELEAAMREIADTSGPYLIAGQMARAALKAKR
jgi:DNA-binding NtrC family response regulator